VVNILKRSDAVRQPLLYVLLLLARFSPILQLEPPGVDCYKLPVRLGHLHESNSILGSGIQ
jgi:hypothetical protein